jgi:hypothetical protein
MDKQYCTNHKLPKNLLKVSNDDSKVYVRIHLTPTEYIKKIYRNTMTATVDELETVDKGYYIVETEDSTELFKIEVYTQLTKGWFSSVEERVRDRTKICTVKKVECF